MSFGDWIPWTTEWLKHEQIHAHSFEPQMNLNLCCGAQALLMQHFSFKWWLKAPVLQICLSPLSLILRGMPMAEWHVDLS